MLSTSLAQLPGNRDDLLTLSRKLQLAITALDKISGNSATLSTPRLSRLEGQQESVLATLPDIVTELRKLSLELEDVTNSVATVNEEADALSSQVEQLELLNSFNGLANNDLDDLSWGSFVGLAYASLLGSDVSNLPAVVIVNAAATYKLFVSVRSAEAFSESLHLIGDGGNRYFVRSGSNFADAITNGWIEL